MKRNLIITEDGSHSLFVPEIEEHFHSTHGAMQESMHVFIKNGLKMCLEDELVIFEVGFGTGLNSLLTLANSEGKNISYISIEKYPLSEEEYCSLNYAEKLDANLQELFLRMHATKWNEWSTITPNFRLLKLEGDFCSLNYEQLPNFNLIYFDAFAPNKQDEMWNEENFRQLSQHTKKGGRFVTYCAQGEVRRKLMRSGFSMQRVPGPPMKRQMLVGEKL